MSLMLISLKNTRNKDLSEYAGIIAGRTAAPQVQTGWDVSCIAKGNIDKR